MNFVPFLSQLGSGFKNTFAQALKIRPNSNHTTLTRRKISDNFEAHDSEGAQSSACLALERPDLEVLLMLQTPAALHLMSASRIRLRKAAFTQNTRYFFFNNSTTTIYNLSLFFMAAASELTWWHLYSAAAPRYSGDKWPLEKNHESSSPCWILGPAGINSSFPVFCPRFVHHGPSLAQSVWPVSARSSHPAVNPSSLECSSFQEHAPSSSQHARMLQNI